MVARAARGVKCANIYRIGNLVRSPHMHTLLLSLLCDRKNAYNKGETL